MNKLLPDPVTFFVFIDCFGVVLWVENRLMNKGIQLSSQRKNLFILSFVLVAAVAYTVATKIH